MKTNRKIKGAGQLLLATLTLVIITSFSSDLYAQEKKDQVFEEVAVMPKFNDGDVKTFRAWVMQNVKFPEAAKKDGVQGKVSAEFIVEKDGSVKEVKIKRGVPEYFDDEVIRVIKSSPKWIPGKNKDGKIVRVSFTILVNFALK